MPHPSNLKFNDVNQLKEQLSDPNNNLEEILTCVDEYGRNALMIAAQNHPEAVKPILEAINRLNNDEAKQEALLQVSPGGWNALILGAYHHPETVASILSTIHNLPSNEVKQRALLQGHWFSSWGLRVAAQSKEAIFKSILQMDAGKRFAILKEIHDNDKNSVYAQIFHAKRGLFKPSTSRGILGQAEKEYQRLLSLHQDNAALKLSVVSALKVQLDFLRLYPDKLTIKLNSLDNYNRNPLMIAAENHPGAVESILAAINSLKSGEDKQKALLQVGSGGWNALMYAARYHPGAVEPILAAINSLNDKKAKQKVLLQVTSDGWNALMLAAPHHPEVVDSILEAIKSLNCDETKQKALLQVSIPGYNALMYATDYNPEAVKPILLAINSLKSDEDKQKALLQVGSGGWNALMYAARYHAGAVEPILAAINRLNDKEAKQKALLQVDSDGWNALMLGAYYRPGTVASILSTIHNLGGEAKQNALLQVTSDGRNALMLAAANNPKAVAPILAAINELKDDNIKRKILLQTNKDGKNALMLANLYHSEVAASISEAINKLKSLSAGSEKASKACIEPVQQNSTEAAVATKAETQKSQHDRNTGDANADLANHKYLTLAAKSQSEETQGLASDPYLQLALRDDTTPSAPTEEEIEHTIPVGILIDVSDEALASDQSSQSKPDWLGGLLSFDDNDFSTQNGLTSSGYSFFNLQNDNNLTIRLPDVPKNPDNDVTKQACLPST